MTAHTLGEITLSISTIIYFMWFVPQIILNYQRKSTEGFSLWMHGLLLIGYTADLLYGFGQHMEWQYRLVTIVGLCFLLVEHVQIAHYNCRTSAQKWNFAALTTIVIILLIYAVMNFTWLHHGKRYYNVAGFISDLCWMTYVLPQIIKNFRQKSTQGLSIWFVIISLVLSGLDITSTFALHWAWPSILSECVTLVKKSILIFQVWYYRPYKLINTASQSDKA